MTPEERAQSILPKASDRPYFELWLEPGSNDAEELQGEIAAAIRAAIAEEREGCASIVDSWGRAAASIDKDIIDKTAIALTAKIAAAIRARL